MSTYSPNLRIELPANGSQPGVWGNTTNNNLGTLLEGAISGYTTVAVTSANQALTANFGAADESRMAILRFTTSTTAIFNVYAPPVPKVYIVWNNTAYDATLYNYNAAIPGNTTPVGTGVAIKSGSRVMVWSNGTNFYSLQAQSLTETLGIALGGTGQTTANAAFNALAPAQTNNRVLRSNGTDTSFQQVALGTDVTGNLPVANGGTGGSTSTGSGAVVLATNPTISGPTFSGTTTLGPNWSVVETAGVLFFRYAGVNKMKIDSSGNITVTGNVTAFGSV